MGRHNDLILKEFSIKKKKKKKLHGFLDMHIHQLHTHNIYYTPLLFGPEKPDFCLLFKVMENWSQ
jgi:hypothetical protein